MYRVQSFALVCVFAAATVSISSAQSTAANSATSNNASSPERVVIKVGDTKITKAQFDELYADFRKANQGGPMQSPQKIADDYASALMLSKQAIDQGLDKNPELVRQLELNRLQILSNAAFESLEKQAKPTSQEVEAYYNSHLSDFDQVDIRRLFIYKQTAESNGHGIPPQEAKARADEIRKVLASGGDAKALIANTKDALDAEPITFRRGELPGNMAVAFDMKVGEWSQFSDTPDALSMFEVVKKDRLTAAQAAPIIERKLQGEKLREEMEALKEKSGLWMDDQYFAAPVSADKSATAHSPESKQEKD